MDHNFQVVATPNISQPFRSYADYNPSTPNPSRQGFVIICNSQDLGGRQWHMISHVHLQLVRDSIQDIVDLLNVGVVRVPWWWLVGISSADKTLWRGFRMSARLGSFSQLSVQKGFPSASAMDWLLGDPSVLVQHWSSSCCEFGHLCQSFKCLACRRALCLSSVRQTFTFRPWQTSYWTLRKENVGQMPMQILKQHCHNSVPGVTTHTTVAVGYSGGQANEVLKRQDNYKVCLSFVMYNWASLTKRKTINQCV